MKLAAEKQYVVAIEGCDRCGQNHVDGEGEEQRSLLFNVLDNPQDRNDLWTYCPVTHQPILISSEDV